MPSGKKRKGHKMSTHKRKKRLRKNRHKKKRKCLSYHKKTEPKEQTYGRTFKSLFFVLYSPLF